jgi:hypothetical protein
LLRQFNPTDLVLGRNLAFATLPRMELVGIEFMHGLFIAA